MTSRIFSIFTIALGILLSFSISATPIQATNHDTDGSVLITWSFEDSLFICESQRLNIYYDSNLINTKQIEDNSNSYNLTNLSTGNYKVNLIAKCQYELADGRVVFENDKILGELEISIASENKIEPTFHDSESQSLFEKPSFNSSNDGACLSRCQAGNHSISRACVANCSGFNFCNINGNYNYYKCEKTEGLKYQTCDTFCAKGYKHTGFKEDGGSCDLTRYKSTQFNICEMKLPNSPKITSIKGKTTKQSYYLTWSKRDNTDFYKWRLADDNSWKTTQSRSTHINLNPGLNLLQVKACNRAGCSTESSGSIIYHPNSPEILSSNESFVSTYLLTWSEMDIATYYYWSVNGGKLNQTSGTSATISLTPGKNTIKVWACYSAYCSEDESTEVNYILPPSKPVITSSDNSNSTNYNLTWENTHSDLVSYHSWKLNDGEWKREYNEDMAELLLVRGDNTIKLKACHYKAGCSEAITYIVNLTTAAITAFDDQYNTMVQECREYRSYTVYPLINDIGDDIEITSASIEDNRGGYYTPDKIEIIDKRSIKVSGAVCEFRLKYTIKNSSGHDTARIFGIINSD